MLTNINAKVLLAVLDVACLTPAAQAGLSSTFEMSVFQSPESVDSSYLFTVTVSDTDVGADQVRFTIANESTGLDSTLASIYFDDNAIDGALAIFQVLNPIDPGMNVDFSEDAIDKVNPGELPGASIIGFETTTYLGSNLAIGAAKPGTTWGLNNGEYVDIIFDLIGGDPVSDIIKMVSNGTIRVGTHIQSIGENEFSASAVTPIPAPGAGVLAALGLMTAGYVKKRRQAKDNADQAENDETPE